ncbi:MAG: TIGR04255 family protein [Methanobrevibacter sp.]|nr:TIGR04255 family protein [Methanobrevibacter sp.]
MTTKYTKNSLNEVIFHLKFSPLSKIYSNKKEAVSEFQKHVKKEFPEISFEKKKKIKYNIDNNGKLEEFESNEDYLTWIFRNNKKEIQLNGKEIILIHDGEIYSSFESYMKDVDLIIKGLEKYGLESVNSIGLRYINQIKIDDETKINQYFNQIFI